MSESINQKTATKPWPDLSAYQLHFGIVVMPNGAKKLVLVDSTESWAHFARKMGFKRSRWSGLWVQDNLSFTIPGFKKLFPKGSVVNKTDAQIIQETKSLVLERQDSRFSAMDKVHTSRLSWHPNKIKDTAAAISGAYKKEEPLVKTTPSVVINQTIFLGKNYLDEDVYENGDGSRYTSLNGQVISRETGDGSAAFLRASTPEELIKCAHGMVKQISAGRNLHSEDFERYVSSIFGNAEVENVMRFHEAVDVAIQEEIQSSSGSIKDIFENSIRLHDGRPSYWRSEGSHPTPLPISVVMQSIAQSKMGENFLTAIDIAKSRNQHSWLIDGAISVHGDNYPIHSVALGGVYSEKCPEEIISSVRVSRADHKAILDSLERRNDEGVSVFVIASDEKTGKLDSDFKRIMSVLGPQYDILGLTDIDPKMLGCGNTTGSRLLVVGNKKKEVDHGWSVPSQVEVIYDYESLWNWAEVVGKLDNDLDVSFGSDDRESNRWQSPYIPSSQISEPKGMSPRNMLAPVRRALARIVDTTGLSIDDYVSQKLQMSLDDIEEKEIFDAEQMDAIALAIFAIENGESNSEAFILGDVTGFGKGRTLAAVARYLLLNKKNVMFFTEKSSLFRDIYRDIEDIGSLDLFKSPIIKNANIELVTPGGAVVGKSTPKDELFEVFMNPQTHLSGGKVILSTYSQLSKRREDLKTHPDSLVYSIKKFNSSGNIQQLIEDLEAYKPKQLTSFVEKNGFDRSQMDQKTIEKLDKVIAKEIQNAKAKASTHAMMDWISFGDLSETVSVMDEAHNAAGEDSNINSNLAGAVDRSMSVIYSSATFAKETSNFSIFRRVFPSHVNKEKIGEILGAGGVPLQEILSVMLAEDGKLIRREHDLSNLEFRMSVDTARKERNEAWSDAISDVICGISRLNHEVMKHAHQANRLAKLNNGGKKPAAVMIASNFSSRLYNIMRAFSMSVNSDFAVEKAISALKQGIKPVIGVENTMESVLNEILNEILVKKGFEEEVSEEDIDEEAEPDEDNEDTRNVIDPLTGLPVSSSKDPKESLEKDSSKAKKAKFEGSIELEERISFKTLLSRYIERCVCTKFKGPNGTTVVRVSTAETEAIVDEINKALDAMPEIPLSPLDYLTDKMESAGYSITEISGRKIRLVERNGKQYIEKMPARVKNEQIDGFNSGDIDAAIISKSGSTGCSLHSSHTFRDQSQRSFIELQAAQNIRTRFQFWGRINRKGQVCNPIIEMISSGLPAEMRLSIMQNANLRKMSASISGNADNSGLNENVPDIINKIGSEVCYRFFENNPECAIRLGCWPLPESFADGKTDTYFVDQLTSRICMLKIEEQIRVYDELVTEFNSLIEQYEMSGTNPLRAGMYDIKAKKKESVPMNIGASSSSVFSKSVIASTLTYDIVIPPINKEETEKTWKESAERLASDFGVDHLTTQIQNIKDRYSEISKDILPAAFSSVTEAEASQKPNAVKNLYMKVNTMVELLKKLQTGSIVSFTGMNYVGDKFIILDVEYAENRICAPSEYKIKMRGLNESSAQKVSLSSLFDLNISLVSQPSMMNYEEKASLFYKSASSEYVLNQERVIMDGNLFGAAEISELVGSGQPVSYTNENGVWQHAILMPKGTVINELSNVPVSPASGEELYAYFKDVSVHTAPRVFSTPKNDRTKAVYEIFASRGLTSCSIISRSAAEKAEWLLMDEKLKEYLVTDFMSARGARMAVVNTGKLKEFMDYFQSLAASRGVPVYIPHGREWQQRYHEKKRASEQQVLEENDDDLNEFSSKVKVA